MRKHSMICSLLTATLTLSLGVSSLAYQAPDFSDVPQTHWAYQNIMTMAERGVIKGTGDGSTFSPDMKLSAEMFLTLVGRIAFPDVDAAGADWSGPYVTAAESAGWLDGTKISTADLTAEVTRYDMAVVLAAAGDKLGLTAKKVNTAAITDYGDIPNKYTAAVETVFGMGLITGDASGNFNGTATMGRAEVATVLARLTEKAAAAKEEAEQKAAEEQKAFEESRTGEYVTISFSDESDLVGGHIGFYHESGRLLGDTYVDEDGTYTMTATMDKADYDENTTRYYLALMDELTLDGWEDGTFTPLPYEKIPQKDMKTMYEGLYTTLLGKTVVYWHICSGYAIN